MKTGKVSGFQFYTYNEGEFFDFRNLKVVSEEEVKSCINKYIYTSNKYPETEPCELCGAPDKEE